MFISLTVCEMIRMKTCYLRERDFEDVERLIEVCPYSLVDDECSYKKGKCYYLKKWVKMYRPPNDKCPGTKKCPHFKTIFGCLNCSVYRHTQWDDLNG